MLAAVAAVDDSFAPSEERDAEAVLGVPLEWMIGGESPVVKPDLPLPSELEQPITDIAKMPPINNARLAFMGSMLTVSSYY